MLHEHMLNPKTLANTAATSNSRLTNPITTKKTKSFATMDVINLDFKFLPQGFCIQVVCIRGVVSSRSWR